MFTKNKVFAYENSDGDKGIIIARSIDEAEKIFHKKYPERKIVDEITFAANKRTPRLYSLI